MFGPERWQKWTKILKSFAEESFKFITIIITVHYIIRRISKRTNFSKRRWKRISPKSFLLRPHFAKMQTNVCCCFHSFAVSGYSFLMKKLPFHTAVAVLRIFGRNKLGSFRSGDPILIARYYFRDFEILITNVSKVWVDSNDKQFFQWNLNIL